MPAASLAALCRDLLAIPTAPFREHGVRSFVVSRLAVVPGLRLSVDEFGNVHARIRRGRAAKRFVFAAHMDHPGFVAVGRSRQGKVLAEFRGGLPAKSLAGARILFHGAAGAVPARVLSEWREGKGPERRRLVRCSVRGAVRPGDVGTWAFPPVTVRGSRVFARAWDDLGGVACLLALMRSLAREKRAIDVTALFTRAEEMGFRGALAAAASGGIPRGAVAISVEASSEKSGARLGAGPAVRVGDSASVFDPEITRYLVSVAASALPPAGKGAPPRFQRRLIATGACEGTAFQALGLKTGALSIPLGHYHNQGPNDRIAPEIVDLRDLEGMVALCRAAVLRAKDYGRIARRIPQKLKVRARQAMRELRRSALAPAGARARPDGSKRG